MVDGPTPRTTSICIPVFNGGLHLDAAIRSARNQVEGPGQILILDDDSSDDSLAIAEKHRSEDKRIRVIVNRRNLGMVSNWNRCIAEAEFRWVKFLFQDDLLAPVCLSHLCKGTRQSGARLSFAGRRVKVEGQSPELRRISTSISGHNLARSLTAPTLLRPPVIQHIALKYGPVNVFGEPSSVLLDRSLVHDYGAFDVRFRQLCDLEYWLRVGCNEPVWLDTTPLVTFRLHPGAMSAENQSQRRQGRQAREAALLAAKLLHDPAYEALRCGADWDEGHRTTTRRLAQEVVRLRRSGRRTAEARESLESLESDFGTLPELSSGSRVVLYAHDLVPTRFLKLARRSRLSRIADTTRNRVDSASAEDRR